MKRLLLFIILTCTLVAMPRRSAIAHPPNAILHGNDCATCHGLSPQDGGLLGGGEQRAGAMSVVRDFRFDPDESEGTPPADWQDRGLLKVFTAEPGETIELTMQVEAGAVEYAVQLKRLEKEGFSGRGNVLVDHVTPDPDWIPQGFDERTYYTHSEDEFDGHDWPVSATGPVPYSFLLTLGPDTPPDIYDLEFATAGIDPATSFGKWYSDEHFYLQVVPEPDVPLGCVVVGSIAGFARRRRNGSRCRWFSTNARRSAS